MNNFKNIDRIFQERLKDYEVLPPYKSWDAIEKQLQPTVVKRGLPFWFKIASIAAVFVMIFGIGTIYLLPNSTFTSKILPIVSKSKENETKDVENKKIPLKENSKKDINTLDKNKKTENIAKQIGKEDQPISESKAELKSNKKIIKTQEIVPKKTFFAAKKEAKHISNQQISSNKFTVSTIFAPIYFNSFGGGSGVDEQFKNNSTSSNTSYSYGVKFAYQISDKFSLQSGVNLISLGYTTNNIYVVSGNGVVGFSNLSAIPLESKNEIASKQAFGEVLSTLDNVGRMNQVFGYIEIPVEVKYSINDGKLGINVVGGFSTLLLNNDEVIIETNSFSQSLGSSNNLRSVNFSGNIGVDVDYLIHKNLYINISPMFKVQTNTFSKNAGSFQPYYLGVYTGLNYKF
ncbi:outer membrane beta-barrel protein [Lutibacter sp.]|uniref:outer membrane beta-barrel protein n=1 Tax=Lutibacter sp. TaxID=1925666 RepID=UPI0027364B18|nr:outer membrane beta-barrel protein [Lutibacter sp.]MDP3313814.1 outer membrane beta-barrel protein [Lutibacter sp.]